MKTTQKVASSCIEVAEMTKLNLSGKASAKGASTTTAAKASARGEIVVAKHPT